MSRGTLVLPACALVLFLLGSCSSTPVGTVVETPAEQQSATLDSFTFRLLDIECIPDRPRLFALRTELDRAAAQPGLSRRDQAVLESLRAEAAFQAGDQSAAKRLVESAAAMSDAGEGVWVVRAWIEPDPAKRLLLLEKGIIVSDRKPRLLCERGVLLLKAGRYAEAAQDLDEGLRGLDPRYRPLYGPDRERAFSLAQTTRDTGTNVPVAQPQGLEGTLSIRAMVEQAFAQTHLLTALTPSSSPTFAGVLPALNAAGLLLDPSMKPEEPALRKNVAFFLWGVVARADHDPKLLTRYRQKYTVSPVADVPVDAAWFDSVLGTVEREIMDLPDGRNFKPDGEVTGLQYLGMLNRLNRMYR